jgi:spore maturation protein CgeB
MKLVVFGLSVSSSWGNGHATIWRALAAGLARRGHKVVFFERDVPYYAAHRDLAALPGGELRLYREWAEALPRARAHLSGCDAAMVTSFCPDAAAACDLVLASRAKVRAFYDLDTPVTLCTLRDGQRVAYLPPKGLGEFDLVLSFTGGRALDELRTGLGAQRVAPLYGCVDPDVHVPAAPREEFAADLSYLGTFAQDRQDALERLFLEPAARLPSQRFRIGGSLYPEGFPWRENVWYSAHVPPPLHAAFYGSSRLTLNVTRGAMASFGFCPSGRLFEAAACGAPVISDAWEGLDRFFAPGEELIVAREADDVVAALRRDPAELARIGARARARALEEHSGDRRAQELLAWLEHAARGAPRTHAEEGP